MNVETRMLLYTVALGAVVGLAALWRRRVFSLWFHMVQLGALLTAAAAGLIVPAWGAASAEVVFGAFLAVAIVPSLGLTLGRRAARRRHYDAAAGAIGASAWLLGAPPLLRREAALYAALAAAERGDEQDCRDRLLRLAESGGVVGDIGIRVLADVLPPAAAGRWDEVVAAFDRSPSRAALLRSLEARAAAETGDLRRALRICAELAFLGPAAHPALASARRATLACGGRAAFLEEALQRGLPVADGPHGAVELAIARAHEAAGDVERAQRGYGALARSSRGSIRRDANAGLERCRGGRPRRTDHDEVETAGILDLETACRGQAPSPSAAPLRRRARATFMIAAVTAVVSGAALALVGNDVVPLLAAGALSAPLVLGEGEWWRLGTMMLLHGGFVHLALNLSAILVVGVVVEARLGAARTLIVYLGSGFLGAVTSVYITGAAVAVGASGAAMGLLGALLVLVLRCPRDFEGTERRRWLSALVLSVGATALLGVMEHEAIDNAAHAGGFLAGVVLGWLVLPGPFEGERQRATRRLVAGALGVLLLWCAAAAARQMGDWAGTRHFAGAGVEADLPSWLAVELRPPYGLLARRDPLPLRIQLAREPAPPAPELLLDDDPSLLRLYRAGPVRPPSIRTVGDVRIEERAYGGGDEASLLAIEVRRGRAYALVIADEAEADALARGAIAGIARSLRIVE